MLRTIGVLKAAINHVLVENDLDLRNVFQGLKIKGAGSSKTDRLPVTDDQLATLLPVYATSPVPEALFVTLADTGARLAEIVGLEAQDLDLDKGCLNIRHNSIRRLKTKTSDRVIPLSRRAQELLRLDLSRFDAAPLIAFTVTKETDYGTETDGGIPPRCSADCTDQRADAETGC